MPLIIRWPGVINAGTKNDRMVQNIDFAPTFLEIAGISIPDDIQGRSILPLLRNNGRVSNWREQVYYHYYAYPDWHMVRPHYGIRTERYKLIHHYSIDEWELFDLEKDPDEMMNVYANPEYSDIVSMMSSRLEKERITVGDTVMLKATSTYRR